MAKTESPRKEYYANWYNKNKERISEKRKKAYNTDPVYREKLLMKSSKNREIQRAQRPPRKRKSKYQEPRAHKTGDGKSVVLYSVTFFSLFIERSVQSINEWEEKGILPKRAGRARKTEAYVFHPGKR